MVNYPAHKNCGKQSSRPKKETSHVPHLQIVISNETFGTLKQETRRPKEFMSIWLEQRAFAHQFGCSAVAVGRCAPYCIFDQQGPTGCKSRGGLLEGGPQSAS